MRFALILVITIICAGFMNQAEAQVYTPRVNNDRLPDYTEPSRFAEFPAWRDLPEQEKAVKIWEFLADYETGLYPVQGIYEDPDPGPAYPFFDERDLVKVLNVHGHGYCGLLSPTLDGIFAHAGFSDSRIHNMDANHHCITEVWFDDGWRYFDLDLRGMLLKPDGSVASVRDAMTVPSLWTDPPRRIEPFYPLDDKTRMFDSFAACKLTPMYHWYKNGHTMDFALRPGESLTRFWYPQNRWFHSWPNLGGFDIEFLTRKFEQQPRGLKSKHDGWSRWTHGNALFTYSPRLTSAYEDFERGAYDHANVRLTALGIETTGKGKAFVTFEVRSPYIIVGRVHELDRPEKTDDGATVSFRSLGPAAVSLSTDNGLSWKRVGGTEDAKSELIDFTQEVLGTYGYLLRFDFREKSGLAELCLNTWGQLAPVSLPRLLKGENRLNYSPGDRYGYSATVKEIRLNLRDPAALARHTVSMNADYQPLRHNEKLKGEVVLKVGAKPGTKIKWFTAGGYFRTYAGSKAARTANAIYYSTAGPDGPWKEAARSRVPDWVAHWHYGMDPDVVLDEPAETVYLKYVGDPAVNQIWIYAHCQGRTESNNNPVKVTHCYEQDGEVQERTFQFSGKSEYTINCETGPVDRYIRFELPSQPAPE